jgi:hypothetical protein
MPMTIPHSCSKRLMVFPSLHEVRRTQRKDALSLPLAAAGGAAVAPAPLTAP